MHAFLLTFALVLLQSAIASGQDFSAFTGQASAVPPEGVTRYGSIEVAWVRSPLSGERLFQVAAPTVLDRASISEGTLPVDLRAQNIAAQLSIEVERFRDSAITQLLQYLRHGETLTPRRAEVIISTLNNRPVLQISSSDGSRPLTIATVTQTDVNFYSETPDLLAEDWRNLLQTEVAQLEQLATVEAARQGIRDSLAILLGAIVATGLFVALYRWVGQNHRALLKRDVAMSEENATTTTGDGPSNSATVEAGAASVAPPSFSGLLADRSRFLRFLHKPSTQGQKQFGRSAQWLLVWLIVLTWYGTLIGLSHTLPMLMQWRSAILSHPFRLILIWFAVTLALRVSQVLIQRFVDRRDALGILVGEAQRKVLRSNTIGGALKGLVSSVLVVTGLLLTLSTFGISTGSILAWSAVLGLAVSFGTQSLVKDVVNGCLILLEDQFAVGDVIIVNGMAGFVEEMNLRITRLRDPEGQLITIPNGAIAEVRNLTRLWSRVDFTIEVAYENNPDKVLGLLNKIAQDMYNTPEWREKMPDPPEVLGIDQLTHAGILIRVWIKTAPLQQWLIGREYRLRVRREFEAHGITIGKPQWITHTIAPEQSRSQGTATAIALTPPPSPPAPVEPEPD
ncbi:MAG: mechanosensitive ion channel family protein [Cyanobacteria bacterium P01_A01_bin.135]